MKPNDKLKELAKVSNFTRLGLPLFIKLMKKHKHLFNLVQFRIYKNGRGYTRLACKCGKTKAVRPIKTVKHGDVISYEVAD